MSDSWLRLGMAWDGFLLSAGNRVELRWMGISFSNLGPAGDLEPDLGPTEQLFSMLFFKTHTQRDTL